MLQRIESSSPGSVEKLTSEVARPHAMEESSVNQQHFEEASIGKRQGDSANHVRLQEICHFKSSKPSLD